MAADWDFWSDAPVALSLAWCVVEGRVPEAWVRHMGIECAFILGLAP